MASGAEVWSRFSADPRQPGAALLKATDADRDVAVDALREAFADGRLTRAEYDDRSGTALAARTIGAFLPLLVDLLPAGEPPAVPASADLRAEAVRRYERDRRDARNGWVLVSGICLAVWGATSLASGGLLFFWPVFPMLGVGIGAASVRLQAESRIEAHEEKIAETRRRRELE
jgi:hypothetical protein